MRAAPGSHGSPRRGGTPPRRAPAGVSVENDNRSDSRPAVADMKGRAGHEGDAELDRAGQQLGRCRWPDRARDPRGTSRRRARRRRPTRRPRRRAHRTARGRSPRPDAHGRRRTSRSARTSATIRCESVDVCRSAACLSRTSDPNSHSGAASQATRRPGASSLLAVPSVTTRSLNVRIDGTCSPRKRRTPYGSSSTIRKPNRSASAARWRRRSSGSVAPDGFWKLGTV